MTDGDPGPAARRPTVRIVQALAAAAVLWVLALFALAVWVASSITVFDEDDKDTGDAIRYGALAVAVVLFAASGPVAFAIGRRRWLLALPGVVVAFWLIGVLLSFAG